MNTFTPRASAAIAGTAYLLTSATSFANLYFASTRTNYIANAPLFRLMLLFEIITFTGCVVLNAALYDLLAPVHRSIARIGAFFRIAESGVYGASTVYLVLVLSLATNARYAAGFADQQLQTLVQAFRLLHGTGFWLAMLLLSLGSTAYVFLLFRSRFVPRPLAMCGLVMGPIGAALATARVVYPGTLKALFGAVQGLPLIAIVIIGVIAAPFVLFEVWLGLWLLFKGVRV